MGRKAYVKKKLHPLTWLCMKLSDVFSFPKSSTGSAQSISHMRPDVGGSLNRLIYPLTQHSTEHTQHF